MVRRIRGGSSSPSDHLLPRSFGRLFSFGILLPRGIEGYLREAIKGFPSFLHLQKAEDLVQEPSEEPDDTDNDNDRDRRRYQRHQGGEEVCCHAVQDTADLGPVDLCCRA